MTDNTARWSWSIGADNADELTTVLSKIVHDSVLKSKSQSLEIEAELAKAITSKATLEQKLTKRRRIADTVQERCNRRLEEYEKARQSLRLAKRKSRAASHKVSVLSERQETLNKTLGQEKLFLDKFGEVYSQEAFENRSFMLLSINDSIDSDVPIDFTHDRDAKLMTLVWNTSDIFINDGEGGKYPLNFGRFKVKVTLSYQRGMRNPQVIITPVHKNFRVGDYVHPHIKLSGEPCLGNVARMLIEHMANQDVAQVIYMVTEYLCHYNSQDPYRTLSCWGVANPYDNPGVGLLREVQDSLENSTGTNPCGLSPSECLVHHNMSSSGECSVKGMVLNLQQAKKNNQNLAKLLEAINHGKSDEETNG